MHPNPNAAKLRQAARDYYDLCDRARSLGIDTTATDDPEDERNSVAFLRAQVEAAEARP